MGQEIPCIEFYEGLPTDIEVMFDRSKRNTCIIDDQLVENLFTSGRHLSLSVVFVSQNLFYTGKKCRTISLNSTYIVVFKNPRDQSQIRHLACQMFPSKPKFLQAAYDEETKNSLSPNLRKYYEAREEMNDWLEKDDVPEDTKAQIFIQVHQNLQEFVEIFSHMTY